MKYVTCLQRPIRTFFCSITAFLLVSLTSCIVPLEFFSNVEKIDISGPSFSLDWDASSEVPGVYSIYVRKHETDQWNLLSGNLNVPKMTVKTDMLEYGKYDFAVSFTVDGGSESELHTSLENTAIPHSGWYLDWVE